MLTDLELTELHNVQLEIMDYIHQICEKYDIKYFLAAGTCIGAVRHNGYIPWDFDIDIQMVRKEYDRFEEAMQMEANDTYKYLSYKNQKDYYRPHAVVVKDGTEILTQFDAFNRRLRCNYGIYVDILPLDNSDGVENDTEIRNKVKKLRKLISIKKGYVHSEHNSRRLLITKAILRAVLFPIPLRMLNEKLERTMRSKERKNTNFFADYTSKYSVERSVWPKCTFDRLMLHEFEGRQYYIPVEFDSFLKTMYGDYMKLPTGEQISDQRSFFSRVVTE